MDEVFHIEERKIEVPAEWLTQVDNVRSTYPSIPQNNRFSRQSSMWDQRSGSEQGPFGFMEHSPEFLKQAAEEAMYKDGRGKGGRKNNSKKGLVLVGSTETADDFIPGPLDESNEAQETLMQDIFGRHEDGMYPVGDASIEDLDDLEGYGAKYGGEALEAWKLIDDFMPNLEECDDILLDIIRGAYAIMTSEGQMKIAQEGIR